jgi:hypothetical protein
MDKGIVSNNSYEDLINSINHNNSYILVTLDDKSYEISNQKDHQQIILTVKEITEVINNQWDLYNNYELIKYLIQSLNHPVIVFNKSQFIEFTNHWSDELLGLEILNNTTSMQQLTVFLNDNYIHDIKNKNQWKINKTTYNLTIKFIGNFTCWLLEPVQDTTINQIINNVKNNIINNIKIFKTINHKSSNPVKNECLQKITNSLNI